MILNINFEYSSGNYYLCYMDENNLLNIIEDAHLKITSFESNIRRFYLVGDFANKIIHSEVSLKGSNKYGYEAKLCINKENPNYSDFIYSSSSVAIINDINTIYENAIPIDILITSSNSDESLVCLSINIEIASTNITNNYLTGSVVLGRFNREDIYSININGETFNNLYGTIVAEGTPNIKDAFRQYNIDVKYLDVDYNEIQLSDGVYYNAVYIVLSNYSDSNIDVEMKTDNNYQIYDITYGNYEKNTSVLFQNSILKFTLMPEVTDWVLKYTDTYLGQASYFFEKGFTEQVITVNLTSSITSSLHDSDMQQWQAVKDAANELTGVTNWVFDTVNSRIQYNAAEFSGDFYWQEKSAKHFTTVYETCLYAAANGNYSKYKYYSYYKNGNTWVCEGKELKPDGTEYAPEASPGVYATILGEVATIQPTLYISFAQLAQKIISNASSSNENVSLLAQAYLENIANSVSNSDESKQFITLDYLKSLLPN